jgi:phage-related protein
MAEVGTAYVTILPSAKGFAGKLRGQVSGGVAAEGSRSGKQFGQSFTGKATGGIRSLAGGTVAPLAAALVGLGAIHTLGGFITDARESQRVGRLTAQVIKSTGGAAKISAGQVSALATAVSNKTGVDDEAIQSGENLLLTFTGIRNEVGKGNDIFNQATGTIVDMSAALGTDTSKSAIQLGKALNDPIKGVSALSKVGVSFTAQQKEQIKTLVKSGNTLGAQKLILKELGREFGGAAAATATPVQKLKVQLGNIGEAIGGALLPVIDRAASFITGRLIPAFRTFGGVLGRVLGPAFRAVISGVKDFISGFTRGTDALGAPQSRLAQFGAVAFGVMRKLGTFVQTTVLPALRRLGEFVKNKVIPALIDFYGWAGRNILTALRKLGTFIQTTVIPALHRLGEFVQTTVIPALRRLGEYVQTNVIPALRKIGTFIAANFVPAVKRLWAFLVTNLKPVFVALVTLFVTQVLPALRQLWARVQAALPTFARLGAILVAVAVIIVGKVMPVILRLAGPILRSMIGQLGKTISIIAAFIRAAIGIVTTVFKVGSAIVRFVSGAIGAFKRFAGAVGSAIGTAVHWIAGLPGRAVSALSSLGGAIARVATSAWHAFTQALITAWHGTVSWLAGVGGAIVKSIGNLGKTLLQAGADLIGGLATGIRNSAHNILDAIKQFVTDKIPDWMKKLIGAGSPARMMVPLGVSISEGMALGIEQSADLVHKAAASLVPSVNLPSYAAHVPVGTSALNSNGGIAVHVTAGETPRAIAREVVHALNDTHALRPALVGV